LNFSSSDEFPFFPQGMIYAAIFFFFFFAQLSSFLFAYTSDLLPFSPWQKSSTKLFESFLFFSPLNLMIYLVPFLTLK